MGMEVMPLQHKLCTFDCVYCECGFNTPVLHPVLPTRDEVRAALEAKLSSLALIGERVSEGRERGCSLDVITFSGNGEPTLHPDFLGIIQDTCALRDQYCPQAKVSVLSNSTQLGREDVVEALRLADNRILKLDAGTDRMMHLIDMPLNTQLTVAQIEEWLAQFGHDFTLQTCFLRGEWQGQVIDNTTPEELEAWYAVVRRLMPRQAMIYVIDRATPVQTLSKVSREDMERIAAPLRAWGIDTIISA